MRDFLGGAVLAFGRYALSAGAATLVDVGLVQVLLVSRTFSAPSHYWLAIALGALCGMTVNYLVSRRYVFAGDDRRPWEQFQTFLLVSLGTLLLRLPASYGIHAALGLPFLGWLNQLPFDAPQARLAHLGAVGMVTTFSFLAHKHVSFGGGLYAFFNRSVAGRS